MQIYLLLPLVIIMSNNVIPLFDDTMLFEHYVCNCGSELFFITTGLGAVCYNCRDWMVVEKELILDGIKEL